MQWDAVAETVRLTNVQRNPAILRTDARKNVNPPNVIPRCFVEIYSKDVVYPRRCLTHIL